MSSSFIADYDRRFAKSARSGHDAHRPLQPSDDLDRVFSRQETRLVSANLTVHAKRVPYRLEPTDTARDARKKRVGIEERENGTLRLRHGQQERLATAFPKEHRVQPQGEVVENERLSAVLAFIKERQHEQIEARIAKSSTRRRDARLLREGTPRRQTARSPHG